jgi:hypothetical protein
MTEITVKTTAIAPYFITIPLRRSKHKVYKFESLWLKIVKYAVSLTLALTSYIVLYP